MDNYKNSYTVKYTQGIWGNGYNNNGMPRTTTVEANNREQARVIFLSEHRGLPYANSQYYVISVTVN